MNSTQVPTDDTDPELASVEAGGGDAGSTRDRLLASAISLMAAHGSIDAVSLRAVASGAGVSPTAVYRHFDDHDALLVAALDWAWGEFDRALTEASRTASGPHARFERQLAAYVAFARERTGVYAVLFASRDTASTTRSRAGREVFDKMASVVADVLRANGDDREPFTVATQVFTSIHGIAHLRIVQPTFPWPDVGDQMRQLIVTLGLAVT